jgi:tellurite methyltransferase
MHHKELNKLVGNVDIYLLDHILKGTFEGKTKLLDAGCGEGRNLKYFINNGFDIYGIDSNPMAIKMAQMTYKAITANNFSVGNINSLPYEDGFFDSIICMAVLHFAKDHDEFVVMLNELQRVLKPDGVILIRLATDAGLTDSEQGGFPYVLQSRNIKKLFESHALAFTEPWKSVVVEGKRSMGSFMLKKSIN